MLGVVGNQDHPREDSDMLAAFSGVFQLCSFGSCSPLLGNSGSPVVCLTPGTMYCDLTIPNDWPARNSPDNRQKPGSTEEHCPTVDQSPKATGRGFGSLPVRPMCIIHGLSFAAGETGCPLTSPKKFMIYWRHQKKYKTK